MSTAESLLLAVEAEEMRRSFKQFVRLAWPVVEPAPFVDGWCLDALIEHLAALTLGQFRFLLINIPPRHTKPVYNESMILLSNGSRKPIANIIPGEYVITHAGQSHKVLTVADQGILSCVKITTDNGRQTIAACTHPFLTPDGWIQAGDLRVGMSVANVMSPQIEPTQSRRTLEEFRLAGYFIGDGSTSHGNAHITSTDVEIEQDLFHCAKTLGFVVKDQGFNKKSGVPVLAKRYAFSGGTRQWLKDIGMAGCTSYTKRVPSWVFEGSQEQIAHFIAAYFMCDGTVGKKGNARTDLSVEFCSVSPTLLADVQHLFLRLGIQARLVKRMQVYKDEPYTSYRLTFTSQDELAKFKQLIPIFGPKKKRLDEWFLPRKYFDRPLVAEQITAIEDAGMLPCSCIEVEGDHTYTSDDIVVHNSTSASVLWPVWDWIHIPQDRFLVASYNLDLAIRDNGKKRSLIESPWFQARFGSDIKVGLPSNVFVESARDFSLTHDQNARRYFANDKMGYQLACSVGSSATGQGGSKLVIDDAHAASEAHSDADRLTALTWFRETWSNRMNQPSDKTLPNGKVVLGDCMLVVGQRIHELDVPGHILRERTDWVHLNLPAEYDPRHQCVTPIWRDPRTEEGELLWPERFSKETLIRYKRDLGSMGYAAQYQQLPVPAGGGNFKKQWFRYARESDDYYQLLTNAGAKTIAKNKCWKFSTIDLATATKQSSDYTVIQCYAVTPQNELILIEQHRERMDSPSQVRAIRMHYMRYEPDYMKIETTGFQLSIIQQLRTSPTSTRDYIVDTIGDPISFEFDVLFGFPQMDAYLLRKDFLLANPYVRIPNKAGEDYYVVRVLGDVSYFLDLMAQQGYCDVISPIQQSSVSIPIREYHPTRDKSSRATVAAVLMEAEQFFFLEGAPYLQDVESELVSFPKGAHDDIVDACSMAADVITLAHGPLSDEDEGLRPVLDIEDRLERGIAPPIDTPRYVENIDPFEWSLTHEGGTGLDV